MGKPILIKPHTRPWAGNHWIRHLSKRLQEASQHAELTTHHQDKSQNPLSKVRRKAKENEKIYKSLGFEARKMKMVRNH